MLNCMLLTQDKNNLEEGRNRFEEENEVYLTSLQKAFSDPSSVEHLKPYFSEHDIEVFRRLEQSGDARLKYIVYKADGDFLVFSIGIFDSAGERSLPLGPEFRHGHQGLMGKGDLYYHFLFSFSKRVPGIGETVREVLAEMSKGFDKYTTILSYVMGEHFDIAKRLSGSEVYHFARSAETGRNQVRLERKQNEFLDAYMAWKSQGTEDARSRVMTVADELRAIDPTFTYEL